ncbi:MAG: PDZ domain-containing protein [Desulfovibrionales bacterium]|nr:PDZ domain-containing protein [Desulfovibrionales bacterium]
MRTKLWAVLFLVAMVGCAKSRPITPVTWSSVSPGTFLHATGIPVDDAQFITLAADHDFILVGESHTNPCDHAVQVKILESLASHGTAFVLGLEMVPVTAQPVLDQFHAGEISAQDLGDKIGWEDVWGHPYRLYRPIFVVAQQYHIPIVALNIPRETLLALRDQSFSPSMGQGYSWAPEVVLAPSPEQQTALVQQAGIHKEMQERAQEHSSNSTSLAGNKSTQRFFTVQALWDSMMAEQALKHHESWGLPMVIFAGGGHVEHGWGIEYRLRTLKPEARCLGIMPVRDTQDLALLSDSTRRTLPGEMIYYYCAAEYKSRLGMHLVFVSEKIQVQSIEAGSLADKAGLRAGDILTFAGGKPLENASDLHFAAMAASRHKKPLVLQVQRGSDRIALTLPLP